MPSPISVKAVGKPIMVTEQSFATARTPDQALDELSKMSGTRFDGMLVRLLLRGLRAERTSSSSGV